MNDSCFLFKLATVQHVIVLAIALIICNVVCLAEISTTLCPECATAEFPFQIGIPFIVVYLFVYFIAGIAILQKFQPHFCFSSIHGYANQLFGNAAFLSRVWIHNALAEICFVYIC